MKFQRFLAGVAAVSFVAVAMPASAAVIVSGGYSAGIGENGTVYDASGVGLQRPDGYDVIAQGQPYDSWGINTAYATSDSGANTGTSVINAGVNSAVVTTDTGIGFTVEQTYSFVGNILKIDTVVTNETADALSALFQRSFDFDLGFADEVIFGPIGSATGIRDSSWFGLDSPDPATPYNFSCKFGCNETGDLGAGIKINLGTLNAGASRAFTYYYGLNREGTGVNDLIADAQAAGAKYLVAGRSGDGANSAIIGVSGAVPEPATWAMMILGFFGLGGMVRRRRAALA
jgi:hypothetical protein